MEHAVGDNTLKELLFRGVRSPTVAGGTDVPWLSARPRLRWFAHSPSHTTEATTTVRDLSSTQ
jgi:hypothetical protein